MSKVKKDKEVNTNSKEFVPENTYDPQYIPYFIQGWLSRMVVQYHVKHIQIQESMAGTIITLIAESNETFPDISGIKNSRTKDFLKVEK